MNYRGWPGMIFKRQASELQDRIVTYRMRYIYQVFQFRSEQSQFELRGLAFVIQQSRVANNESSSKRVI